MWISGLVIGVGLVVSGLVVQLVAPDSVSTDPFYITGFAIMFVILVHVLVNGILSRPRESNEDDGPSNSPPVVQK
jgi:hypothetical protein